MATSDDLTDAKLAAAEARTETKVVRLEGKIENLATLLTGKLDALKDDVKEATAFARDTRLLVLGTIAGAAIALGGLVVGMATYGDARFGRGMDVRNVIKETIEQAKKEISTPTPTPEPTPTPTPK